MIQGQTFTKYANLGFFRHQFPTLLYLLFEFDSRSLKTEGQEDIKFSLVGFGGLGELAKPHTFTSGSKIFNDKSKMTPALNNLKNNGKNGDVFEALQYAARLGFRPGVTKTFVLVLCDDVTNVLTSKAYGDRYGFT